jgi:hypothetical protein
MLMARYPLSIGAERARIEVLLSTNLVEWQEGTPHLEPVSLQQLSNGHVTGQITAQ